MQKRILLLPLFLLSASVLAAAPVGQPIEVALKIHSDIKPYTLSSENMPAPSWSKDGTLTVLYPASGDGSSHVVEAGARGRLVGNELYLCYSRAPTKYGPNAAIPAIAYLVAVEFRIRGLEHKNYKVQDVRICE